MSHLLTLGRRVELEHVPADRFDQHQFALFPLVRVARLLEALRRQVVDGALLPALDHDLGQFGFGRPAAGQLDLVRVLLVEEGLESQEMRFVTNSQVESWKFIAYMDYLALAQTLER